MASRSSRIFLVVALLVCLSLACDLSIFGENADNAMKTVSPEYTQMPLPLATEMLSPTASFTPTAELEKRVVSVSFLHIRQGPSVLYAAEGVLERGTELVVIDSSNGVWLKVQTQDGTIGFVNSIYTEKK